MSQLSNKIEALSDRLSPVRKITTPTTEDENTHVEKELVELASDIRFIRYFSESFVSTLVYVLERLEL